jgi:hypothetical protein
MASLSGCDTTAITAIPADAIGNPELGAGTSK